MAQWVGEDYADALEGKNNTTVVIQRDWKTEQKEVAFTQNGGKYVVECGDF